MRTKSDSWIFIAVSFVLTLILTSRALANRVTGSLDQWDLWSFETNTVEPECIAGESPCGETDVPPDSFSGPSNPIDIPVEGYAELSGREILGIALTQSEEVVLPIAGGRHGELTLSGIRWSLSDGRLTQVPGAFAKCSTMAPVCRVIAAAIQDPATASPLDFNGIPKNFPIQFGALLLNSRPSLRTKTSDEGEIIIEAASSQPQSIPKSPVFNSAAVVRFRLILNDKEL
jgi:hypothetical protein